MVRLHVCATRTVIIPLANKATTVERMSSAIMCTAAAIVSY
jgi:hypothetical protein